MATNENGNAVFCSGCIEAGNYLGEITDDNDILVGKAGMGGKGFEVSYEDQDGGKTDIDIIYLSTLQPTSTDDFIDKLNKSIPAERMLERIKLCNAGRLARVKCPAIGASAIKQALNKEED